MLFLTFVSSGNYFQKVYSAILIAQEKNYTLRVASRDSSCEILGYLFTLFRSNGWSNNLFKLVFPIFMFLLHFLFPY